MTMSHADEIGEPGDQRPTAALFDLDRTITRQGTYTPFLLSVARHRPAAFLSVPLFLAAALAYRLGWISRGRLKEIMLRRVLGAMPRAQVQALAESFVENEIERRLRPGARAAIDRHRRAGHRLVLITASFDFYAEIFGQSLGFDDIIATAADWDGQDRLTGRIAGENCYGPAKFRALARALPDLKNKYRLLAYSDHHTDADLLAWADVGTAVNPSRRLRLLAKRLGLTIVDWR